MAAAPLTWQARAFRQTEGPCNQSGYEQRFSLHPTLRYGLPQPLPQTSITWAARRASKSSRSTVSTKAPIVLHPYTLVAKSSAAPRTRRPTSRRRRPGNHLHRAVSVSGPFSSTSASENGLGLAGGGLWKPLRPFEFDGLLAHDMYSCSGCSPVDACAVQVRGYLTSHRAGLSSLTAGDNR